MEIALIAAAVVTLFLWFAFVTCTSPAFSQWRKRRRVRRELEAGKHGYYWWIYNRLKSHPDEFAVECLRVYGPYAVHRDRKMSVSIHPSSNQALVLCDPDGVGTFVHAKYDVGVMLAERVDEWYSRRVTNPA